MVDPSRRITNGGAAPLRGIPASGQGLPSGTITFLLTDIEGSTALWEASPEAMHLAVARHDALLTEQVEQHGGVVVRNRGEGDSFFTVFQRATDAVAAARGVQQALHAEAWQVDPPIRVRIGLYTGEAELREGNYYGAVVNRCARLRDRAYGGQVLVSQTTYDLIRDDPPAGVSLLDLGEHRLRGVSQPVRVFQVLDPELPRVFPPLRTVETWPNNLPVQATSLIGRERQAAEIADLLLRDGVRLLTLTGPGGIGKTRLAIEVAGRIAEEGHLAVVFAELAPIASPALVQQAIAGALGVRERVDRPLLETIADALRAARLLLVLDNCEHVLGGTASAVQALRRACPEVQILATSRAPLGMSGEVTWSVPLLTVGADDAARPDAPGYGGAVQLFVERARLRMSEFSLSASNTPAVVEICRRLEGLPLAIELAAARIQLLPPAAMLARLDRALPFLVGGPHDVPARQQTLRAAIAWSYDLLDDAERAAFRQLGVFASGFSLEAAEAVWLSGAGPGRSEPDGDASATSRSPSGHAAPDLLQILESLLAKNLLRREHADDPRYSMLETIREYALEQLEASGERDAIRDRCAAFFLAFAEAESERLLGRDQLASLGRIDAELGNLRAVLGWSREGSVADLGLRLAGALVLYWQHRGFANEGRDWVTAMLERPEASARTVGRARALYAAAILASSRGDIVTQRALTEESAEIYLASGQLLEGGRSLAMQAVAETRLGNLALARTLLAESVTIARDRGDQWGLAFALGQLGAIAYQERDFDAARRFREEAAAVARANHDRHTLGLSLAGLGLVARMQGHLEESARLFHETLLVSSELNDHWTIPRALGGLAGAAVLAEEYQRAARLFGVMVAMREMSGIGEATGFFRALCERDEAEARAALGSEAFLAAWEEGRTMAGAGHRLRPRRWLAARA